MPQTEAIFAHLSGAHAAARADAGVVRLSLDSKATVVLGPFARGGHSRAAVRAVDHDFKPLGRLTPFGIFWPGAKELSLYFTAAKVTSDFMVDRLAEWWRRHRAGLGRVRRLLLDLDNGPENHGYRSQFLYRLVGFAQAEQLEVQLAYYPPYHSKYNPIERCWGVLENYWRGELLDSEDAVLGFARSMTYARKHPEVYRVTQAYPAGVRRNRAEKRRLEQWIERAPGLEKWAVLIHSPRPDQIIT